MSSKLVIALLKPLLFVFRLKRKDLSLKSRPDWFSSNVFFKKSISWFFSFWMSSSVRLVWSNVTMARMSLASLLLTVSWRQFPVFRRTLNVNKCKELLHNGRKLDDAYIAWFIIALLQVWMKVFNKWFHNIGNDATFISVYNFIGAWFVITKTKTYFTN